MVVGNAEKIGGNFIWASEDTRTKVHGPWADAGGPRCGDRGARFRASCSRGVGFASRIAGSAATGQHTVVISGFNNGDFGTYTITLNGAIIGWGLGTQEQVEELRSAVAQLGRQTLRSTGINSGVQAQRSLNAQSGDASDPVLSTAGPIVSTSGGLSGTAGRVNVWGKISNTQSVSSARSLDLPMLQLGADYVVMPNVAIGLAYSRGTINSATTGMRVDGEQNIIQPYLGWQSGDYYGSASLQIGRIDYDTITTTAGTASADGNLLGFSADVARDYEISPGRTISPFASVNLGNIDLEDTTGTLAAAGILTNVDFREIRLGATFGTQFGPGVVKLTVSADHFDTNTPITISSGTINETGLSGTVGLGYQTQIDARWAIDADVSASGLGSDTRQVQAGLKMSFAF